jgi:hypothetical protein
MNHFNQYGYYLLADFFTQEEVDSMYIGGGFYTDAIMDEIYKTASVRLEGLLDTDLLPNFHKGQTYGANDKEDIHSKKDLACEIALTFTIAHSDSNWPLVLDTSKGLKIIHTRPGDALLYKGCELLQMREQNTFNDFQLQHSMYWNDLNSEVGSFMKHFDLDHRLNMNLDLNEFKNGDNLPLWDN